MAITGRAWRQLQALVGVAICMLAVIVLVPVFRPLSVDHLRDAWSSIPPPKVAFALLYTGISFAALGFYDVLASRSAFGTKVPLPTAWFGGAVANAVSNTLGFHAITGLFIRYRVYRHVPLDVKVTATIMAHSWTTLAFGFGGVLGVALLVGDNLTRLALPCGGALLLALFAIIFWPRPKDWTLSLLGFSVHLPSSGAATMQMAIGAIEMSAAISALYVLMPSPPSSFAGFTAAYIGAVLLGIVSHAPGGLGVFEATMLSVAGQHDRTGVLAALLLYRLIYNLLPFLLAVAALIGFEAINGRLSWRVDNAG